MLKVLILNTDAEELKEITGEVEAFVKESGVKKGLCLVYCPHTTAAITINENADPDVKEDFLMGLSKSFPKDKEYKHYEGNSHAHLKSAAIGASEMFIIEDGQLVRVTWQGLYFCEFDEPRTRKVYVKII